MIAKPVAKSVDFDYTDIPASEWLTVNVEVLDAGEMPPHLEGDIRARRLGNGQILVIRLTAWPAAVPQLESSASWN